MKNIIFALSLFALASCGCRCRYNEYVPENNPLAIPEDLRPAAK